MNLSEFFQVLGVVLTGLITAWFAVRKLKIKIEGEHNKDLTGHVFTANVDHVKRIYTRLKSFEEKERFLERQVDELRQIVIEKEKRIVSLESKIQLLMRENQFVKEQARKSGMLIKRLLDFLRTHIVNNLQLTDSEKKNLYELVNILDTQYITCDSDTKSNMTLDTFLSGLEQAQEKSKKKGKEENV